MEKFDWYVVLAGAVFFFAASIVILTGDTVKKSICFFFLIQFAASNFVQLSFYMTIISLMFFPLALNTNARLSELIRVPHYKPLILLLLGWIISLVYATITNYGELKYHTVRFDIYFLLGFVVAYEIYFLLKLKLLDTEKLIFYIGVSGIVVVCYLLAKYFVKGDVSSVFSERFGSSIDQNPNITAAYLDLALPCAFFAAFFEKRNVVKKILLYAFSLIYVCVILMAATRGSLFGIVAICLWFIWRKRSKRILFGVIACAIIGYFTFGNKIAERLFNPNVADVISNMGRVEMLRSAFKMLKENYFFFGIGMNNYSLAKFEYGIPQWFDATRGMSSHNFFVEIWLGWGMLGLLGWVIFNIVTVTGLFRGNKDCGTAYAVAFAVMAFSMHGFVDSVLASYPIMFVYFSLIGVALFAASEGTAIRGSKSI